MIKTLSLDWMPRGVPSSDNFLGVEVGGTTTRKRRSEVAEDDDGIVRSALQPSRRSVAVPVLVSVVVMISKGLGLGKG